ncbi:aspartate/glutamate racemase family protein [Sporolactobacillus laevolacticus]|uniref:Asp/Glu racemase n=1 Tax=Sporolactobacillus laevolacticus DSM 442 TaxID=1395513 RepID=V6IVK7_9BACL|nr:aspartate/glutamate racemase family protein [Sporolactobacillus laevolacticus]EST11192.1 Asp/Glu racemase [Sporolactobacillus laevolacticus DSM 442]MDN3955009.1 aspartate/glutamate racemase family protein [Sporolactobacillus laevolacticus]
MKKLLVINPNTSEDMTASIHEVITGVLPHVDVRVVRPTTGPESLESFYDYQIAAYELIKMVQKDQQTYDGILIACFGDPGLYALKEICSCPVIGIAEASFSAALLLGKKFVVITALQKAVPMMEDLIDQYGLEKRCATVRAINLDVLAIEQDRGSKYARFIEVGRSCVADGAEVLILGCASMTGLKEKMEDSLHIPVIDPVVTGIKMLKMIVDTGLNTSKAGLYQEPPKGLFPL